MGKVIKTTNLPAKLPIQLTIIALMACKVFEASDLVKGVIITIVCVLWIIGIGLMATQKEVDLFDKDKEK